MTNPRITHPLDLVDGFYNPIPQLVAVRNIKVDLATVQLEDWKQKQIINKQEVAHNNVLVYSFPPYAYDFSEEQPLYSWISIYFDIAKKCYDIQLQQEFHSQSGCIYIEHKNSGHEMRSLADILKVAIKMHDKIGKETIGGLCLNSEAIFNELLNLSP